MPPTEWKKSEAKKALVRLIEQGAVTTERDPRDVYDLDPLFAQYAFSRFKGYQSNFFNSQLRLLNRRLQLLPQIRRVLERSAKPVHESVHFRLLLGPTSRLEAC